MTYKNHIYFIKSKIILPYSKSIIMTSITHTEMSKLLALNYMTPIGDYHMGEISKENLLVLYQYFIRKIIPFDNERTLTSFYRVRESETVEDIFIKIGHIATDLYNNHLGKIRKGEPIPQIPEEWRFESSAIPRTPEDRYILSSAEGIKMMGIIFGVGNGYIFPSWGIGAI